MPGSSAVLKTLKSAIAITGVISHVKNKPTYGKVMIYTRHDAYYLRTKLVYYVYSDSKRTKQIGSPKEEIIEILRKNIY